METPVQKNLTPEAAGPSAARAETPDHPLDALLVRLPGVIYRCRHDPARTVEFASAGCHALLGLTLQELVRDGIGFDQLICPQDRERVRGEIEEALARRDTFACEYRLDHAGGRHRKTVWEQGRAVRDHLGEIIALEGYLGDLEESGLAKPARLRREFRLQQSRTFLSMNLFARGVAHDFSNVITALVGSAELLKMTSPPDQSDGQMFGQIFAAGGRARQMIQELKNFSQRQAGQRTLILLPPVVEESLQRLRSVIPAPIEFTHCGQPACPAVLADAAQIQQAVTSLCTNVWQSLTGHEGQIKVQLDSCDVDAGLAAAHPGLHAGPHVRLTVRDRSGHYSEGVLERMFEPFACKQTNGHNSGLELFAVQEIAHAHEGAVTVQSVPGEGTEFCLYFPVPED